MFRRLNKKGQGTLEYAILIAVIVAGLLIMQMYMKRGYQGRLRSSTDEIGEQFSPENTSYTYTTNSGMLGTEITNQAQGTTNDIDNQTQSRTGSEDVDVLSTEGDTLFKS